MIIDTHCHLDSFNDSPSDFKQALACFDKLSMSAQFIAMSTEPSGWPSLLKMSQWSTQVHAALGIHPWYVKQASLDQLALLQQFLLKDEITAIGEIGLDFSEKYRATKSLQIDVLEKQLQLAQQFCKPVSLHLVKAHNELYELVRSKSLEGVIHGLGSSVEVAQLYIDSGFKIGVNGVVLRDNARRYHKLVTHFGLNHIVLESDYPNVIRPGLVKPELCDIIAVAQKVAQLLNSSLETVVKATTINAQHIFKLNGNHHVG